MEPETVLNLFDSYWFDHHLFNKKHPINNKFPEMSKSDPEIPSLPIIHTKTQIINTNSPQKLVLESSISPNSVLFTPKLQTIFSGKIPEELEDYSMAEMKNTHEKLTSKTTSPLKGSSSKCTEIASRRKKKGLSKSLSDLEFEELKGFMDLGFIFSEEDKNSNLAYIIPGLQRLGKNDDKKHENIDIKDEILVDESGFSSSISRPYLSESWEVMEKKRKENCLVDPRVPDPNSNVQMKDYLKCWAHTVASTVR
ncbi:unnamed protein product [Amaranthus hypochondriacus]